MIQHDIRTGFPHDRRAPAILWHSSSINSNAKEYAIMRNRIMCFSVLQNGARVSKTNVSKAEMPMQTTDV